jgi:hypothetical protein
MEDEIEQNQETNDEEQLLGRRDFLLSLKKWSKVVIGGIVLGRVLSGTGAEAAWVNRRATWVNGAGGGGGGGWLNRGGSWINGGGGWINRTGGGWLNGGGGGGSSWVNRRGW